MNLCSSCQKYCCKWGHAYVSERDIQHIAEYLSISTDTLFREYIDHDPALEVNDGEMPLRCEVNGRGCIFLREGNCSIYVVRPRRCKQFPRHEHLDVDLEKICIIARKMRKKK
jgi:Fe-S-cluster containining protein